MNTKSIKLLEELTNAHGAPGFEREVRDIFKRELEGIGTFHADKVGSIYCETGTAGPKVMLEAHMDEVGFRVQNITPDGFIQFVTLGGWWTHSLLSQRVTILTQTGEKILGVVCSKPPHFLGADARDNVLPVEALFIDVGATSYLNLVNDFGINIGDPMVPDSKFTPLGRNNLFVAKAFDNRLGMAGVIETAQRVQGMPLPNRTQFAAAAQEEVGLRGAKTLAAKARPDCAIILEGPPADDTPGMSQAEAQGRLGRGVQIRMQDPTAIMNPGLCKLAIETAQKHKIPYQVTVRRSGGTDAGSFHLANEGIPSIVLGTPARYIHSHNAMMNINDYRAMVALSTALLRELDEEAVLGFTDYLS